MSYTREEIEIELDYQRSIGADDLSAMLEQLQAELDTHHWIPVSGGPPENIDTLEHSHDVLVVCDGKLQKAYHGAMWHIYSSYENPELYQDRITHWMKMPTLPKEGK